ncbi:MAG: glycosyltransferase family 4 protein, partial [Planctomycetota bacterium]
WDHFIVGWATRLSGAEAPVLRTDHGVREFAGTYLWRYYFGPKMIDHLIVLCDRYRVQAVSRLGLDPDTVTTVRGAVDADEFRPMQSPPGTRERFGFTADDVVVGIVARVQRHRRFEALLEAAEIVRQRDPRVKIAVCGRGTHRRSVLDRPLVKMGLQDTVIALGYLREDYREALSMFDAGLMLVPGSDGSCRAALQMAAMGKPLVVARRGVLPDIVRDGETGIVVYDTPENLAEAILEMADNPERRAEWGRAARERMCQRFSPARQAEQVGRIYERLLELAAPEPAHAET